MKNRHPIRTPVPLSPLLLLLASAWCFVLPAWGEVHAATPRIETGLAEVGAAATAVPDRGQAANPILWADVPDLAMIRVGETYYMSSTTMHLSPGLPIMRSKDLVNWELVAYAYDILDEVDELNLTGGKSTYGRGSWASSLRFHKGTYYATTFAQTTGKTHVYSTRDIEAGPWEVRSFRPALHDHTLFFDDDDRVYMLYGVGDLRLVELNEDLSGLKPGGFHSIVVPNASHVAGGVMGLPPEGSQLFKIDGRYYLLNIAWPRGGMRTVILHRADRITGPYESRLGLRDRGVAQGGLIDTPAGDWFAYLFRDAGAVGRIPYLVPVRWEDGWPVLGVDGKVPDTLNLPRSRGVIPGLVASDDFERRPGDRALPRVWQWNHNPDPRYWSVTERPGHLRLTAGRTDPDILSARNTLTQRTFGPVCAGSTAVEAGNLKDGDFAGLALLQRDYGLVGVRVEGGARFVEMVQARAGASSTEERVALGQERVFLKAECDFRDQADRARFYYSLDGETWVAIGGTLRMSYTIPHFMGYRFGLFQYATRTPGGYADFDFFRLSDTLTDDH
ncbi:MAG: glycoside hydrolase 43 family protein [Verrucomicrobiae bacterium]|nr:glycoside hydrolase 43 family protein [Verrucomicrobiae bacterium]